MHPDWPRSIRDQCIEKGIPFFFKQWGEWCSFRDHDPCVDARYVNGNMKQQFITYSGKTFTLNSGYGSTVEPTQNDIDDEENVVAVNYVGKKNAGRLLDGQEWNEYPKGGSDV